MDIRKLALLTFSGYRHEKVKVREWKDANLVICEPSENAINTWNVLREKLNPDGKELHELSDAVQADINNTLPAVILVDTVRTPDGARVFNQDDIDVLKAHLGPVHQRLFSKAMMLSEFLYTQTPIDDAVKK